MPTIRAVTAEPVRVSFAEAEVVVRVEPDGPAAGAEVRGKLIGPVCPGVSTVEVAYPLRSIPGDNGLSLRAVVPEPNLWTPAAPFRYEARVELWVGGSRVDAAAVSVELRAGGPR